MAGFSTPRFLQHTLSAIAVALLLGSCGSGNFGKDTRNKMIVSVRDQKMLLVRDGTPVKSYKISTSKFGIGDRPNSNCTPTGRLQVAKKIGDNQPIGAVFKNRRPTGEVVKPNSPGRDPVVTRILWLSGTEGRNRNAFRRTIYIHGTPEETRLGTPASYGCIRMSSRDVADLYKRVGYGADVFIIPGPIQGKKASPGQTSTSLARNNGKSSIRNSG
jgi:lipoprotein-anchoring transpeptidase ErfK/SrfK